MHRLRARQGLSQDDPVDATGNLDAARAIYKSRGFKLVKSEPYHAYGQDLVSETWELKL